MTGFRSGGVGAAVAAALVASLLQIPSTRSALAQVQRGANCAQTSIGETPLIDLGTDEYRGSEGGLYPEGKNRPPRRYRRIGSNRASMVEPLDVSGKPDRRGAIVLLSVGMSNTAQEFEAFMELAESDARLNPDVALVQGAQGGWDATEIADPSAEFWDSIDRFLAQSGLSPKQVQVVWLKEAVAGENRPFPEDAEALRRLLRTIVRIMKDRYPRLRLVYISSRTYAGYAVTDLNPEPFAYESGFAVKWLIGRDIATRKRERPWLAWGPYLWTDGTAGRSDGLVWTCDDVESDGTHPAESGQRKVAELLLDFFTTNRTTSSWFLAEDVAGQAVAARPVPFGSSIEGCMGHASSSDAPDRSRGPRRLSPWANGSFL